MVLLIFSGVAAAATSRRWQRNHFNRATVSSWLVAAAATTSLVGIAFLQGSSYLDFAPIVLLLFAFGASMGAVTLDRRAGFYALAWVGTVPLAVAWPGMGPWLVVIGNVAMIGMGAIINVQNQRASEP